jgi:hypothetical protein
MAKSNAQKYRHINETYPWGIGALCVLFVFFTLTQEWATETGKQVTFALGCAAVFLLIFLKKADRQLLFEKMPMIFAVLLAQCLLYLAGLFYGAYPKFALQEFFLNMGGLFAFTAAYILFRRGELNIKRFASWFAAGVVTVSLVSIELATSGYLLGLLKVAAEIMGSKLPDGYAAFETNTRITTVLGNPNVFAPIAVLGMFISLWSCGGMGERSRKDVRFMSFAIVCSAAFILCFSLGTILAFGAAVIVYLLAVKRGVRGQAAAAFAFTLISGLAIAFLVFRFKDTGILPLALVVVLSLGLAFLYSWLKPLRKPTAGTKTMLLAVGGGTAVVAVYLVCALVLKGDYHLADGASFRRAIALNEGSYSLQIAAESTQTESAVIVEVSSMSYTQAALKEKTVLKKVTLHSGETASFDVPESSAAVFFSIKASGNLTVTSAKIEGAEVEKELSLHYKLLPEFVVNRLQALWVNDNAIQRFIFFRDGLRIGMTSPVVGLGGGAFEGGLYGVADYYYMTKHSHNELIERFAEGGIVGLLLFAALAVLVFRALYQSRKSEKAALIFPLLCGSTALIFLHALIEVDFQMPAYRLIAFVLLALVAALCDDLEICKSGVKTALGLTVSLACVFTVLLSVGRIRAVHMVTETPSLQSLQSAITLDPFNGDDYRLSYLLNTTASTDPDVTAQSEAYLSSFNEKKHSPDTALLLAQYYLSKSQPDVDKAVEEAEYSIREERVNTNAWDHVFSLYNKVLNAPGTGIDTAAKIKSSITALCNDLVSLNGSLPKQIKPQYAAYSYLRATVPPAQNPNGNILADSRQPCDLNGDGKSDIVYSLNKDTVTWRLGVVFSGTNSYTLKIYQKQTAQCTVQIGGESVESTYDAEQGCFIVSRAGASGPGELLIIKTNQYTDDVYFTIERAV